MVGNCKLRHMFAAVLVVGIAINISSCASSPSATESSIDMSKVSVNEHFGREVECESIEFAESLVYHSSRATEILGCWYFESSSADYAIGIVMSALGEAYPSVTPLPGICADGVPSSHIFYVPCFSHILKGDDPVSVITIAADTKTPPALLEHTEELQLQGILLYDMTYNEVGEFGLPDVFVIMYRNEYSPENNVWIRDELT